MIKNEIKLSVAVLAIFFLAMVPSHSFGKSSKAKEPAKHDSTDLLKKQTKNKSFKIAKVEKIDYLAMMTKSSSSPKNNNGRAKNLLLRDNKTAKTKKAKSKKPLENWNIGKVKNINRKIAEFSKEAEELYFEEPTEEEFNAIVDQELDEVGVNQ